MTNTNFKTDSRIEYLTIELAIPYSHNYSPYPTPNVDGWSLAYSDYKNDHELTLVYETQDLRQNPYDLMQQCNKFYTQLTDKLWSKQP